MPGINNAEINAKIDTTVDSMMTMLKKQLLSSNFEKRGVWDRFKNWMSNLWHGRYGQKNPYYFINTLGDFAGAPGKIPKKECFTPSVFTLHEYTVIKNIFDQLEESLETFNEADMSGVENLRLMRILDDWSKQLKIALKNLMSDHETIRREREAKQASEYESKNKECQEILEQKHKEGKISKDDYSRIKDMIGRGEIEQACKEISLLITPREEPKETEVEPKEKSVEKEPETEDKSEPEVETPKEREAEAEAETKDKPVHGEWPLDYGNTKEEFEKILKDLNNDSLPTPENSYKSRMEDFIAEFQADKEAKKEEYEKYMEYLKTRRSIESLIEKNEAHGEKMEELMDDFKSQLHDILTPEKSEKHLTFESWVKPHHALSIFERTQYFKKMLNKR